MLVVDDDPRNRKLIEGYLRSQDYEVEVAEDGPEALEIASKRVPDVVLLDVMMPIMTGYEVCEVLKNTPETRLSQVMLVTALDGTPDKVEGLDLGADDYVTKPVRREEFLAKVRALLRVRRILVDLEQARSALAARNEELQMKKTLAQSLVHDLKNPLAAILGNLDLLEVRCPEEMRYLVDRSKQGAAHMQKMILNLLDVEALEEGRIQPEMTRRNLAEVIRATLLESEAMAAKKGVEIARELPAEAWIDGDPVMLRRVVENLVSNAVSHSPVGGRLRVVLANRPEGVEISVEDDGGGIPEEHREAVFEKYNQLDVRRAGVSSNRGLGLTFCRLAVEAHGGSIWVEESCGGGASFRLLLPAAVPADSDEPVSVSARF